MARLYLRSRAARISPALYARYASAIRDVEWPCALVDLDGVDANIARITAPALRAKKTIRVATKSIRSVRLIDYIVKKGGAAIQGVMCFSPGEAAFLAQRGLTDLLVAYPSLQQRDLDRAADAARAGAVVRLAADHPAHLEAANAAAARHGTTLGIVLDVDASYRPLQRKAITIGVKRSPLSTVEAVLELAQRTRRFANLQLSGVLAYEAHVAGLPDGNGSPAMNLAKRAMKSAAMSQLMDFRAEIALRLRKEGFPLPLVNGGGSGSVDRSAEDGSLTEIAAGSGFLDSRLFDDYAGLELVPSIFFALEVTRKSAGYVTCQSGGFIASGSAGADRLPEPVLPSGLRLVGLEGAGEVQTPLVGDVASVKLGDPVFFRHAKTGELAEHFRVIHLVRGDRIVESVSTYRGDEQCFH